MFAEIASIAGPLLSGMMGSDSAQSAADTQAASTREAIAEQRRQYDLNRADTADYRDTGSAAIRRLRDLLGLSGGAGGYGVGGGRSLADIASELRGSGRFSTPATGGELEKAVNFESTGEGDGQFVFADGTRSPNQYRPKSGGTAGGVDEAALMAEAQRIYDAQGPSAASQSTPGQLSPGSVLSRRFSADDLANDLVYNQSGIVKAAQGINPSDLTRKFTIADFYADPVVKLGMDFGLAEGTKAIDRVAGAAGLRNSGQTLKALTKFGTDYAGGMAEGSNARFLAERGNLKDLLGYKDMMASGAEDRFTGNQDRIYNQLAGAAGIGGGATNATASLGTGISGNIANLISAGGNAKAAAGIAGGNAWGNAFNTIGNWWNQNQMLDKLQNMQRGASSVNTYPVSWAFGSSGDR